MRLPEKKQQALSQALRQNLLRRKLQQRQRAASKQDGDTTPQPQAEGTASQPKA